MDPSPDTKGNESQSSPAAATEEENPQATPKGRLDSKLSRGLEEIVKDPDTLGKYVNVLEKLGEVFRTKSEDTILRIEDPKRYSSLHLNATITHFRGIGVNALCTNIRRLASQIMSEDEANNFIVNIRGEEDGYGAEDGTKKCISFSFANSSGRYEVIQVIFMAYRGQHLGQPVVKYNYASMQYCMDFALAPTMIIRHHHRKNYLREKSWDSIEYIPTHLSDERLEQVICETLPMFLAGGHHLLPYIEQTQKISA